MKQLFVNVVPAVLAVIGWVMAFIKKHRAEIAAIVKRVEADTADGKWTAEEKKKLAMEIFDTKVYPKLPWYVKLFGKRTVDKWVSKLIEKICDKAKKLKK